MLHIYIYEAVTFMLQNYYVGAQQFNFKQQH